MADLIIMINQQTIKLIIYIIKGNIDKDML